MTDFATYSFIEYNKILRYSPYFIITTSYSLMWVGSLTSGISDSHGVTGGVYKTRERIHRDILIRDY